MSGRRNDNPAWWEFMDELKGQKVAIYTLRYDANEDARRALEKDVQKQVRGGRRGIVWEAMQGNEAVVKPKQLVKPNAVRKRLAAELRAVA